MSGSVAWRGWAGLRTPKIWWIEEGIGCASDLELASSFSPSHSLDVYISEFPDPFSTESLTMVAFKPVGLMRHRYSGQRARVTCDTWLTGAVAHWHAMGWSSEYEMNVQVTLDDQTLSLRHLRFLFVCDCLLIIGYLPSAELCRGPFSTKFHVTCYITTFFLTTITTLFAARRQVISFWSASPQFQIWFLHRLSSPC